MFLGRVKFEELLEANVPVCGNASVSGKSSGLSTRFLSSDFFGFLSFEAVGRTRRVDSMFSVAER